MDGLTTIYFNHDELGGRRSVALVALILSSDVFLNTFLMALISVKSPAMVDVACALI